VSNTIYSADKTALFTENADKWSSILANNDEQRQSFRTFVKDRSHPIILFRIICRFVSYVFILGVRSNRKRNRQNSFYGTWNNAIENLNKTTTSRMLCPCPCPVLAVFRRVYRTGLDNRCCRTVAAAVAGSATQCVLERMDSK